MDKDYFNQHDALESESQKVCHKHNMKNDVTTNGKGSNVEYIVTLSVLVTYLIETTLERNELNTFEDKLNKAILSSLKNQSSSKFDLPSIMEGLNINLLSFDRFRMEIISNGCHQNKTDLYLKLLTEKNSDAPRKKSTVGDGTPTTAKPGKRGTPMKKTTMTQRKSRTPKSKGKKRLHHEKRL